MRFRSVPLVFACVVAACSGSAGVPRWDGSVRDSSGVRIVENGGQPIWRPEAAWRASPALSIGSPDGDEPYLFGRVADVASDREDRLLVLDGFSRDVRIFDGNGAFISRVGGPGEGPGELSQWANAVLVAAGDSIVVPDPAGRRINVYGPNGSFAREVPMRPRPSGQSWLLLEDGRYMFRGVSIGRGVDGSFVTSDGLFATRGGETAVDTIALFEYRHSPLGAPGRPIVPLIVNAAIWTRLADGRIAWSSLDRSDISVLDAEGRHVATYRNALWMRRTVTEADRLTLRNLLQRKLALLGGDVAGIDRLELVYDETFPSITALAAGPGNTLWVQRMAATGSIDPMAVNASDAIGWLGGSTWSVLDAEGRYLGDVTLPGRVRITRITPTAIYGVSKDENDVELVVRLDLDIPS